MEFVVSAIMSFFNNLFNVTTNQAIATDSAYTNAYLENELNQANFARSEKAADNADLRARKFYNDIQSPYALFNQYKQLGASDQAAMMSALGVGSPSYSAPMASTSSSGVSGVPGSSALQGDVSSILNALQNSANSWFNNQKTAAETEQINIGNQWQSTLNGAEVKKILFDMDLQLKRYGLDRDIYENVTKPTANSLIDLNTQEIKNKQQQWQNMCQEYYNLQAQFHETMAKVRNLDANTILANTQAEYTSGALTNKTIAETGYIDQQTMTEEQETILKGYEAQIKGLESRVSGLIGVPITLPMANLLYGKTKLNLNSAFKQGSESLNDVLSSPERQFNKIKHGIDVAFKKGVAYLQDVDNRKRAARFTRSFMDGYFKGHEQYMRKRDLIFHDYD